MNKRLLIVISMALLIIFTVGCGNEATSKNNNEDTNNKENVNSNVIEKDESNEKNNQNNKENEVEELEKEDESIISAEYEVNAVWSIVPINDANEKVVLLTIDDAPDNNALQMAKTLQELDANAIFFVNGHLFETPEKKEIIKEIYDMGFLIGNHTYSHKSLRDLSESEQKEEMVRVNDMVEEITGERPTFFRAPFGENTDYSKKVAEEEGMTLMNWSYGYDWNNEYMSQEAITDIMINTELLRSGANLLMHDRDWTAAALKDIVSGLRDQGYEMVDPKLIKTLNTD